MRLTWNKYGINIAGKASSEELLIKIAFAIEG